MTTRREHTVGLALVIASALAFSVAGVLTKAIAAEAWAIACWRGLVGGALILAYVAWLGRADPIAATFRLGWRGWLLATVGAIASLAFIASFKLTYVANVTVIYATAPFMAAGLGWLLIRERASPSTLSAATVSFVGVAIVVGGGVGIGHSLGNAAALAMTALCALYMVLIRVMHDTPVVLAGGVSALQLFALGWLVTDPLEVAARDMVLLILFGIAFAVATILWTEGTRRIAAADSALAGMSEVPFAVLLAWTILTEVPPLGSLVGGVVILAAVAVRVVMESRLVEKRT